MKVNDAELIEKYQKIYFNDPTSNAFAPLAEAYRKAGMLKEAFDVCKTGLTHNPNFASGHVTMGRVLLDMNDRLEAISFFEKASRLAPENLLAHELLGNTYIEIKQPRKALSAYKNLLFISPDNERIQDAVKKLESLTAEDYDEDTFQMKPLSQSKGDWYEHDLQIANEYDATEDEKLEFHNMRVLERYLSLADAYFVRNDIDNATNILKRAESEFGSNPEIIKRLKLIHARHLAAVEEEHELEEIKPLPPRVKVFGGKKVERLQKALKNVTKNRRE